MVDYGTLKLIHISCAAVSISGFVLRGVLMLQRSALVWNRWIRILPHIVDTVLLVSGITLAIQLQQFPDGSNWLSAKLLALLLYIGLGFIALRNGKDYQHRVLAFIGAVLTFAYMVWVAQQKAALPWA